VALVSRTLGTVSIGPYQLRAAIAAVHDEAPSAGETDWPQILALYEEEHEDRQPHARVSEAGHGQLGDARSRLHRTGRCGSRLLLIARSSRE